jgi:hypothetical protein
LADFKGDEIDDKGRDNEQDQVFYFKKAVEKITGGQEVYPAETLGYKEVKQENDTEEDEKFDRVKYHY